MPEWSPLAVHPVAGGLFCGSRPSASQTVSPEGSSVLRPTAGKDITQFWPICLLCRGGRKPTLIAMIPKLYRAARIGRQRGVTFYVGCVNNRASRRIRFLPFLAV